MNCKYIIQQTKKPANWQAVDKFNKQLTTNNKQTSCHSEP